MSKSALIVWGGWDGHTPQQSAEIVGAMLEDHGFSVTIEPTTEAFADADLGKRDLIVPAVTMSRIEREELTNLLGAVRGQDGTENGKRGRARRHGAGRFSRVDVRQLSQ